MPTSLTPAAFIGHGSPMNAIEGNRFTDEWEAYARSFQEKPKALLVISAHWYWNSTAVTAMARPRTIHDFFGFPHELFAFEYAPAGSPELAGEIVELVTPTWVGIDNDAWGLDHGTWVVLSRMFPEADVPVVQLAINADKPLEYHFELGTQLAPLREKGVMILGSGNVVHNLRIAQMNAGELGWDFAQRFDEAAREIMSGDPSQLNSLAMHDDFALAVPTPDHYIPLLYVAGVAAVGEQSARPFAEGYLAGSLSMTSYALG